MRSKVATRKSSSRRGFGRIIFIIVLIAILVVGGIVAFNMLTGNGYKDEKSFEKYANKYFKETVESDKVGELKSEYSYGTKLSIAVQYPKTGIDNADERIEKTIEQIKKDFKEKYQTNGDVKIAMLTACDTYEGKEDTVSVVVKTAVREENNNGEFEQIENTVQTFTFNTEKGNEVYMAMVFESGYKEKLATYLKDEGYKSDVTIDKFALDGKKAIFYFDAGTLKKGDAISEITIKRKDIDEFFKDEIDSRSLDPDKPMVALTFDDGPSAITTPKILDTLEKNGAVATFFELGENVENVSDSKKFLQRMEDLGCEIGSHSYDHPNLFTLSDAQIKAENDKTDKAIEDRIGKKPTVYRPPYGNGNEKTTKIFNKPGILWSVDTLDWKSRNAKSVEEVIKNSGDLDGKVILMHSIYDSTAEATANILPWLQSQGYQTVTVSELLMYKYNQDPGEVKFYGYNAFYLEK